MGIVFVLHNLHEIRFRDLSAEAVEFTRRDLADLEGWSLDGRRAVVCTSESGPFAMLHRAKHAWASWGVRRKPRAVVLWNCVTFRDVGEFPTMADALAATGSVHVPFQNVFHLAAAGQTRSTALDLRGAR